jgi:hypothetical protein
LWILCALLGVGLAAVAVWMGDNLWPRPMPPALYREAELALPAAPGENAWETLQNLRNAPGTVWTDVQIPEELEPLLAVKIEDRGRISAYWEEAEQLQGPLKAFLQKNPPLAQQLIKISDSPQWVDLSSPRQSISTSSLIAFLDYHRWISLYWIHLALEGNVETALAAWRKVYVQDLAWLKSARSFLSHLMAAGAVREDLDFFLLLWNGHPPANSVEWIQWLRAHPPGEFSLDRAVKYEYLERSAQLESIAANPSKSKLTPGFQLLFNPVLLRAALNAKFRNLEKILRGPPQNWAPELKRLDQEVMNLRQDPFWWFSNPGGKMLLQLVHVSLVEPAAGFLEEGRKAKRLYQRALIELRESGRAPLSASPAPEETLPEEAPPPSPEPEKIPEESPEPTPSPENA